MEKTVLIVDDSATIRNQVRGILGPVGYRVLEASDGHEGLALLMREVVDGVVCDVNMPRMDGLEMLEQMRAEDKLKALPVVMLTTEGQPELIQRAKAAGAKGWIVKPCKPELLTGVMKKLLA